MRTEKKILFLVIILLVVSATLNGIYISMNMGADASWFRWLSFVVTIAVTAFLSDKGIKGLAKDHRTGISGEFFEFVVSLYPNISDGDLAEAIKPKTSSELADQVYQNCLAKVQTFGGVNISEITDRPFVIEDNMVKLANPTEEFLTTNPADYLIEHFHHKTNRLFVTGSAGMGKSHLLRRYIIKLKDENPTENIISVFLPAATYEGTNMTTWILNTCKKLYHLSALPAEIEAIFHHGENVCLFIDGVDELPVELRDEFIKKVYTDPVTSKHKLIISCRERDFDLLQQQTSDFSSPLVCKLVKLERAAINTIIVRNLPEHKARLVDGKIPADIDSPLLISLFTRVATGNDDEALKKMLTAKNPDEVTGLLWEQHIDMVYNDKKGGIAVVTSKKNKQDLEIVRLRFSLATIKKYAGRLANYQGDRFFTINDMQPADLTDKWEVLTYIIATRLIISVVVSTGLGFLLGGTFRFVPAGLVCGLIVGIIYYLGNYQTAVKREKYPWWNTFWRPRTEFRERAPRTVVFFFVLLLLLAPFFMLTGMRRDMGLNGTLAIADSIIAIFFTVMFMLVIGIGDRKYGLKQDIRLVERNNLRGNTPGAIKSGLYFAFAFSIFVAVLSVLFVRFQPGNMFSTWLRDSAESSGLGGFGLTVCIVFPIALIIGFVLGLNNQAKAPENTEKEAQDELNNFRSLQYNINYSVATTVRNTLIFWALSTVIIAVLWGSGSRIFMGHGWDGMNRGIECAIGAGLFIALFWGGNDLIKTGVLRIMLRFREDIPLKLSRMLWALGVLDIVQRNGAIFQFEHQTLRTFLKKNQQDQPISRKVTISLTLAAILMVSCLAVVKMSIRKSQFWDGPQQGFQLTAEQEDILLDKSSLRVTFQKEGKVAVTSTGLISVGRIAGYVSPLGTEAGFFAMPIRDVFDVAPICRHGAVIYRNESEPDGWKCLGANQAVPLLGQYRYRAVYHDTLSVRSGHRLVFGVNDLEPENNSHSFSLNFSYVDPASSPQNE